MSTKTNAPQDARDASLRVSKQMRDNLKAAAAVMGRPLYDVTIEAIEKYLDTPEPRDALAAVRKNATKRSAK